MQEEPGARREQCPRDRPQHGDGPPRDGPLPSPVVGCHQQEKTAQRLLGSQDD